MTEMGVLQEAYTHLTEEQRAVMVQNAVAMLQSQRFETELNATMSDQGTELQMPMPAGMMPETAGQRLERLDRQIERLRLAYPELLALPLA